MLARSFDDYSPPPPRTFPDTAADHTGTSAVHGDVFPHHADGIPPGTLLSGAYELRFAWTRAELHAVQALRFRVFAEERGQQLSSSSTTMRDDDARDPWFHHLMIVERSSGAVVGTYRVQSAVMAATRFGFYSATLFEIGAIPAAVLGEAVEAGRSCVDPQHRSGTVLRLLWRGIARYLKWNNKRYLFGCCSLSGVDQQQAIDSWCALHARQLLHDRVLVRPRVEGRVLADDGRNRPLSTAEALTYRLPPLFEGYLSLGARVCGAPAFDHEFGSTDYLVLLDTLAMDPRVHRSLFK